MEDGEGRGECLFSLELLVESARVEPRLLPAPLPASGPFRPAVALRLLDFPTLLVRAPHSVPGPLVPFGRGKSCLFRLRPEALKSLLRRSPLYALLLVLPPTPGPARLLGSSSVSLAAAAEELLLGTGPGGRRGQFPLRDLMGEPVGELALSYRLSNLGCSLLEHLGQGAAPTAQRHLEEQQEEQQRQKPLLPSILGAQSERGLKLELIPEGEEDRPCSPGGLSMGSLNSTFSEPPAQNPGLGQGSSRELDLENNIFCPPPMYYSRPVEKPTSFTPKTTASIIARAATVAHNFLSEEESVVPTPVKKESSNSNQEHVTVHQTFSSPEQLKETLSQLPLLNALLIELSLLSNQTLQPGCSVVHPQLAQLYQTVEESPKESASNVKILCPCHEDKKSSFHRKDKGRSPSPRMKRNRTDHLKCMFPSLHVKCTGKGFAKNAFSDRYGNAEKNYIKENSPPRRKLAYGLTNSLKLRLQRSNPGVLKIHEKREHRRKKQGDFLFEKKSRTSGRGKVLRCSPEPSPKCCGHYVEKSISDQNAQINENVETLIQSNVDKECCATEKEVHYDLQAKAPTVRVKSSMNPKARGSVYKEKSLKVHLPMVSLHDTDAFENKVDLKLEKSEKQHDSNISAMHADSQRKNIERGYGLKNSSDLVASAENTAYSEDFTNVDSFGTSLGAREISPDSLLLNTDRSQSVMDSTPKMSERSQTAERVSPPLPTPSATSPVQSSKKNHHKKSRRATASKDDNGSLSVSASGEEAAIQKVKKKESNDTQISQNKQTHHDTVYSVEKCQSSVEKSQSLRTSQVSSYMPSNGSELDFSGFDGCNTPSKEKEDDFEMDVTSQCKHVSELVVNKLPGYTVMQRYLLPDGC